MTRRQFIMAGGKLALITGAVGIPVAAAHSLKSRALALPLAGLPPGFDGLRAVVISDVHHGIFFGRDYVRDVCAAANALSPDIALLLGDYAYLDQRYLPPVIEELGTIKAPLGTFAVLGNHDIQLNRHLASRELRAAGIAELTNASFCLKRGESSLWLCGLDDLMLGRPDLAAATRAVPDDSFAVLLSHNPDAFENVRDPRIRFGFAGHTHGGQVYIPFLGSPVVPSAFGQKYRAGFVRAPDLSAFVTTGSGAVFPPIRIDCPPEVVCFTLQRENATRASKSPSRA